MLEPIISGLLLGSVLALLVGPVFFMIINTSIKKGFLPASMLAFGVLLSDSFFVILTYYGSSLLFYMRAYDQVIGISGGLLILSFGVFTFFKKATVSADALEVIDDSKTRAIDIVKGFTMNTLNPSALLFWLGVAGTISVKEHFTGLYALLFYGSTLGMVFGTDLLKAWVSTRLKGIITGNFLVWMNRISGLALAAYGVFMIVKIFSPAS
ncbi:MAG: LysE family transporter [Bacteroidetes bacterium]|nr:LysE family transporter [Bacteroidota bacterium]